MKKLSLALVYLASAAALMSAQTQTAAPFASANAAAFPTATPTVVRTTKAMHYRLQGGNVKVDFQGTDLSQRASGEAKVEGKKANITIDAKFQGLDDATKFGLEYLTYVLWAVSPQGRAESLGELVVELGVLELGVLPPD